MRGRKQARMHVHMHTGAKLEDPVRPSAVQAMAME
jgi:hypothetical protein